MKRFDTQRPEFSPYGFSCELWTPTRLMLLEFPDMQAARDFLTGDEYAPVKKLRNTYADCTLAIFEGI